MFDKPIHKTATFKPLEVPDHEKNSKYRHMQTDYIMTKKRA